MTLETEGRYDVCAKCGWEDDPAVEWDGPDAVSGPNHMSLRAAQKNFKRHGTMHRRRYF
jgi:hypothetical protein